MNYCSEIHRLFNRARRFSFPFNENNIPANGIYVLFETGEHSHGADRIVRFGTHTGEGQLRSRLKQHFVNENKDRSIFRKNIGRAILEKKKDPFIEKWEIDLTSRQNRQKYCELIDFSQIKKIEKYVTKYIQSNFSFVVFGIEKKDDRLSLESKLISTVSLCKKCKPSEKWLGNHSPKQKIRESGLWLINELYKKPLTFNSYRRIRNIMKLRGDTMFVEHKVDLINSVRNFMKSPNYWRDAIGSHPKYFVHFQKSGEHYFGISKFCAFKDIDLIDYINKLRYETYGGVTQKYISKILGKNWIPLERTENNIRVAFEQWFFSFFSATYDTSRISIISIKENHVS